MKPPDGQSSIVIDRRGEPILGIIPVELVPLLPFVLVAIGFFVGCKTWRGKIAGTAFAWAILFMTMG